MPNADRRVIDTVQAAAAATAAVQQKIHAARGFLRIPWQFERPAVLMEPRNLRLSLIAAREQLDDAIAIMDAAKWPNGSRL